METINSQWSAYADLQKALSRSSTVSPKIMALEAALNATLAAMEANPPATMTLQEIGARALNSANWLERSHRRIRLKHHSSIARSISSEVAPIAAVQIREIQEQLSGEEWPLIYAIATGHTYDELSSKTRSAQSLRVRVSRIRANLRSAA